MGKTPKAAKVARQGAAGLASLTRGRGRRFVNLKRQRSKYACRKRNER